MDHRLGVCILMSALLSTMPVVQANQRYVLTGGPGVGKSTLIVELQKHGYQTIPETYALLFEQAVKSNSLEAFFADPVKLYDNLLAEQLKWELALDPKVPAFLDRSAIDIIAFGDYFKVPLSQEFRAQAAREYDLIFFLEPLPCNLYEQCAQRKETREEAKKMHELIWATYIQAGYQPHQLIDVPYGTVQERVEFILAAISGSTN